MEREQTKGHVLVVDDDGAVRGMLTEFLVRSGCKVIEAADAEGALAVSAGVPLELVITDLKMPGEDGIWLIGQLSEREPGIVCVVMTAYGTIESAVQAMRAGAFDYLSKPFNLDEVEVVVRRALEYRHLRRENEELKKELDKDARYKSLLGYSTPMQEVFGIIKKVADTDATVLITGESGTGKEVVARTVHTKSGRAKRPMVPVNCGAIPEELLESELFGHEKGAFSGATHTRMGRFEMAHRGSIFLDEVGDMSPSLQSKLLRVLQEREFERVGGSTTIRVDVRVIAATNHNLERLVEERAFREDLFYRLNVIQIKLPPLRDRLDDLPVLVEHFMLKHGWGKKGRDSGLTPDAMEAMRAYSWPGNVRELENVIERACILKDDGPVTRQDLPEKILAGSGDGLPYRFLLPMSGIDFNEVVDSFERDLIAQALERSGGVKNRAARLLGLGRTTLVEKMKKKRLLANG